MKLQFKIAAFLVSTIYFVGIAFYGQNANAQFYQFYQVPVQGSVPVAPVIQQAPVTPDLDDNYNYPTGLRYYYPYGTQQYQVPQYRVVPVIPYQPPTNYVPVVPEQQFVPVVPQQQPQVVPAPIPDDAPISPVPPVDNDQIYDPIYYF